jgi:transposase
MPYKHISDDIKYRCIFLLDHPEICENVAEVLGISTRSIQRWRSNYDNYGSLRVPSQHRAGRRSVLTQEQVSELYRLLKATPELYLTEIHSWVNGTQGAPASRATVYNTIRRGGFSHRKLRLRAAQRDEEDIEAWKADFAERFVASQIISIDESSKDGRNLHRTHGWGLKGQCTIQKITFARGERWSLLPALTIDGYITKRVVLGSIDTLEFNDFILEDVVSKCHSLFRCLTGECQLATTHESISTSSQCDSYG